MNAHKDTLSLVRCGFLISLICLDQFPVDPANAPNNATRHQLVTLCRSIYGEERAHSFLSFPLFTVLFPFTDIVAVLQHLGQGVAPSGPHVVDTSDTSGDESEASHPHRRIRSKRWCEMKKVWGADEIGRFFVTGSTDTAGKPDHFCCGFCRKDVSVLTHVVHEVLGHFHGVKLFARVQQMRVGTPGWRVLDFERNPLNASEPECQRERILRGPLVIRDRK